MKAAYLCGPPDKKGGIDLSKGVKKQESERNLKNKLGGKGKSCIFAARL